jgi:membrane protein
MGRVGQEIRSFDVLSQAMVIAATGLVTIIPLLLVLSSFSPFGKPGGLSTRIVNHLGLDQAAAHQVSELFATPSQVKGAVTVGGIVVLVLTGAGFGSVVQQVYQRVWRLEHLGWRQSWRQSWRQLAWVAGYLLVGVTLSTVSGALAGVPGGKLLTAAAAAGIGVAFFVWGPHMLLAGRVTWRNLVPGAVATTVAMGALTGFSALLFSASVTSSAREYGPIGVIFVLLSYFIGVGVVLTTGAIAGAAIVHRNDPAGGTGPLDQRGRSCRFRAGSGG